MNQEEELRLAVHDFSLMIDAKRFALELMDSGVQFTFSANPICITYPVRALPPKG